MTMLRLCMVTAILAGCLLTGLATQTAAPPAAEASSLSVLVLNSASQNAALNMGGENKLVVREGNLAVNSSHSNALFNANSTIEVQKGAIGVVGGAYNLGNARTTPVPVRIGLQDDPYASMKLPSAPPVVSTQQLFVQSTKAQLKPGIYVGGITAIGEAVKITMQPGVYAVAEGDVFVSKAQITGKGVTIIMLGKRPGRLSLADGARVDLAAPEDGPLKGIVVLSQARAAGNTSHVSFSGCQGTMAGAIYAPQAQVGFFSKAAVVVDRLVCYQLVMNTGATLEVTGKKPPEE